MDRVLGERPGAAANVPARAVGRIMPWVKSVLGPDKPYIWLGYLPIYALPWLWRMPSWVDLLAAAAALPVFLWLFFRGLKHEDRRALPYVAGILALSFALSIPVGNFTVISVYAAALAGQIRPPGLAARSIAAVVLTLILFCLALGIPWLHWVIGVPIGIMVGIGCMFSAKMEDKNRELEASRDEVRILAATAERERIARDLHDLLGHTLTVVAVKSELAAKLITRDPARAVTELEELNATARRALADIREAVSGMRSAMLGAEVAQARQMLAAMDVALTFRGPSLPLPVEVEGVLAMLVREGMTNIARHARASRVDATVEVPGDEVVFTLTDDGVGGTLVPGNGLAGMQARVTALGGCFRAEAGAVGGTRLTARIPLNGKARMAFNDSRPGRKGGEAA